MTTHYLMARIASASAIQFLLVYSRDRAGPNTWPNMFAEAYRTPCLLIELDLYTRNLSIYLFCLHFRIVAIS